VKKLARWIIEWRTRYAITTVITLDQSHQKLEKKHQKKIPVKAQFKKKTRTKTIKAQLESKLTLILYAEELA